MDAVQLICADTIKRSSLFVAIVATDLKKRNPPFQASLGGGFSLLQSHLKVA